MKTRDHAQLLAVVFAVHAVLEAVALAILAVVFGGLWHVITPELAGQMEQDGAPPGTERTVGVLFGLIFGFVILLVLAQVLLNAFAGYGIWKARSWGRVVGILSSMLTVMSFPIGTAIGVYGFWFLFGEKGREWFEAQTT